MVAMKPLISVLLMGVLLACDAGCKRRADTDTLNLFAWSEYIPQEVIDGFTAETGVRVNYETYDKNETMLVKLSQSPGHYDLVQPSEYAVEAMIRQGMLEPIDFAQVPNVKNLDPKFRDPPYDPGQKYSIPYMAGTVGIVVNTEAIKDPVRGYADVFQPKYNQRIVALDDNREIVSWAFDVLGIPVNDVTPANLERARPLLRQWLPLVRTFNSDDPKAPLASGDCDLGVVYSGDAARLYQENRKFRYVLPAEGAHEFIDNLCVPKGAPHREAALRFINYILRPEVSKKISDKFPYTNPNAEARKLLTPEQLGNPASYPQADRLEVFHDIGPATHDLSRMMTELRSSTK